MAVLDVAWKEVNSEFGEHEIVHHNKCNEEEDSASPCCHNLTFEYEEIDQTIVLRGKSLISQSTGLALWTCSQILCGYLLDNPHHVKDKCVLELGAGLGLCGIVAHHLGASRVLTTDGDVNVLENLRYNIKLNSSQSGSSDENNTNVVAQSVISCPQLVWGKELHEFEQVHGQQNVIVGADIFYAPENIDPIWQTVDKLLKPDGSFLLAFCPHKVSIGKVLDKARQFGFSWVKPNIMETSGENDEEDDNEYLVTCSFGYHVYIFQRSK